MLLATHTPHLEQFASHTHCDLRKILCVHHHQIYGIMQSVLLPARLADIREDDLGTACSTLPRFQTGVCLLHC